MRNVALYLFKLIVNLRAGLPAAFLGLAIAGSVWCQGLSGTTANVPPPPGNIKVVFDEKSPGVVYIESNGERIRVDTAKKTVEPAAATTTADNLAPSQPQVTAANDPSAAKKPRDG